MKKAISAILVACLLVSLCCTFALASGDTYKELHVQDKGDAVTRLQERLKELGYLQDESTGKYDEKTFNAIKAFQTASGLDATGTASPNLQSLLFSIMAIKADGSPAFINTILGSTTSPVPTSTIVSTPVPTPTTNPLNNFSDTSIFADLSDNDILAISEAVATEMQKRGIYTFIELKKGDKGQDVIRLQTCLSDLGYLSKLPSGVFDSDTQSAMKAMEKANSLKQDGTASIEEQKMLSKGSIKPKPPPTPKPTPRPTPSKKPKPTATPYIEPKYALKDGEYADWGKSYGYPWFKWQVRNTSAKKTIDGFTLKYYCVDVYGNEIEPHGYGEIYQYETINKKIKPGKTAWTDKITIYGCDDTKRAYVAICKIHFTDGTTVEYPEHVIKFYYLEY